MVTAWVLIGAGGWTLWLGHPSVIADGVAVVLFGLAALLGLVGGLIQMAWWGHHGGPASGLRRWVRRYGREGDA